MPGTFGSETLRDQVRYMVEKSQLTPLQRLSRYGVDHSEANQWAARVNAGEY